MRNPLQPSTKDVHTTRQMHTAATPVRPTSAPPLSSPPRGSSLWDPENETGVSGAVTEAEGWERGLRAHPTQSSAFNATSRLTPRWKRVENPRCFQSNQHKSEFQVHPTTPKPGCAKWTVAVTSPSPASSVLPFPGRACPAITRWQQAPGSHSSTHTPSWRTGWQSPTSRGSAWDPPSESPLKTCICNELTSGFGLHIRKEGYSPTKPGKPTCAVLGAQSGRKACSGLAKGQGNRNPQQQQGEAGPRPDPEI